MEIDIYNIPIAQLTESYLEYINNTENFSLENAEEYIVMAATLLHIKSKSLLPVFDDDEYEEPEDLVQQLIEYKNYKELSEKLETLQHNRAQFLEKESIDLENVGSIRELRMPSEKLLKAMEKILKSLEEKNNDDKKIVSYRREVSLEEVKDNLLQKFITKRKLTFFELIESYHERQELVLVFISLLTMIKDQELICSEDDNEISLEYKLKEE
ncbi:segregation and condensation protein A [Gemella cuniculi]